jgi:hypothetical protein
VQYRTVFAISTDLDGVSVDAFYSVDMHRLAASMAVAKLTGEDAEYAVEVKRAFTGIVIRSRYTDGGPYNLHTDDPLDRGTLETLLRERQHTGTLRDFLNKAKV